MGPSYLPQFYTIKASGDLAELERSLYDFVAHHDWTDERIISVSHEMHTAGVFHRWTALITTEPK